MIANDQQLQTTLDRIAWFQRQAFQLRRIERNPSNYQAAVSGFLTDGNGPHAARGPRILQLPSHGDSGDGLTRRGYVTLSRYNERTSP